MNSFLIAIQFLTRIPVNIKDPIEDNDLINSVYFYPLIGLIIGIILTAFNFILVDLVPFGARAAILMVILVFLSGGLHLDGFMDTVDGLGSGASREKALEIMRDSNSGAFGVIGAVLLLLLKLTFLQSFSSQSLPGILLVLPVVSRWAVVAAMPLADYARSGFGLGKVLVNSVGWKETLFTLMFTLIVSIILTGLISFILIFFVFLFLLVWTGYLNKKIGGITGDTLGATIEITELLVLFILLVL